RLTTPAKAVKVYEDPFSAADDETTPRPPLPATVLEEVSVNEETFSLPPPPSPPKASSGNGPPSSPERSKKDVRLLDSGIAKRARDLGPHHAGWGIAVRCAAERAVHVPRRPGGGAGAGEGAGCQGADPGYDPRDAEEGSGGVCGEGGGGDRGAFGGEGEV
ncbi:hypothetical protein V496_03460, partial [Pseudogymnoascus sp. VKM F-4515 (FW-2607)]